MRQVLGWMMAALLCCAAGTASGGQSPAEREQEAQAAYTKAMALLKEGQYSNAIPVGEQALALTEAALGERDPRVALCLDVLGRLHLLQGAPQRAEPLLLRGLSIREAALGKSHPEVAIGHTSLADLYRTRGQSELAMLHYQRALDILEGSLGKDHLLVATSLNNLAGLYADLEIFEVARFNFARALTIKEKVLGENHPLVANSLVSLSRVLIAQGEYKQAEPLLQRALVIQEAALGKAHPDLANTISNLGIVYLKQGLQDPAGPLLERALGLREAALGPDHPLVAQSLYLLGMYRWEQQRLAEAVPLLTRAFALSEQYLREEMVEFSEVRLDQLLKRLLLQEDSLYAMLREHPDNAALRRLTLGAVLLLKGRSVAEFAETTRVIHRSLGARDRDTFQKVRELRTQRAALLMQPPSVLASAAYRQRLSALSDQSSALGAELARHSAPLRELTALPPLSRIVEQVAAALPKDGGLVEFIAYEEMWRLQEAIPEVDAPLQVGYLALVLEPDGDIRTVDLGPAEPIDRAASCLRDALARRDADFQVSAQALYRLIFQPLIPLLGDSHRLFLSPDDQLNLVPFAALHDGRQFLVDSFDFTYLTSGRELLPRSGATPASRSVVVLADPDFSARLPAAPSAQKNTQELAQGSTSLEGFLSTRAGLAEQPWTPLPGTRLEARAIQRLIPQAQVFLGRDATKERLLRLPTPGVLHLATHGFFLEDSPAQERTRGIAHFGALGEDRLEQPPFDPLLRSGLVLAGARARAPGAAGTSMPRLGSSLVTAFELEGLDLWGTELVVLSACDTGRGNVMRGQGVYGLRRALVIAGAETVVMSLWKVNDGTTHQLMEAYYHNLLAGQGRATALREAMRALRETQPHPHYWAPFIAQGRDAPLRSFAKAK
ncbi:CHAT domain-containing tetratricopeptide repeat protein [Hyalangium versicolor]|uniref:CHAT domain-containing tetratricopeptide repeat protein n=1 Tax=Hyalangium versicolor TaxID=2861190 RepID=UPI001CC9A76E|nr:CHAT domain-containing tetratricopeptide repeat protein [Hyalangium versicolor]